MSDPNSEEFVEHCRRIVDYWNKLPDYDQFKRLSGVAFSILAALDGVAGVDPPSEDRRDMLHEIFYGEGSWRDRPVSQGGKEKMSDQLREGDEDGWEPINPIGYGGEALARIKELEEALDHQIQALMSSAVREARAVNKIEQLRKVLVSFENPDLSDSPLISKDWMEIRIIIPSDEGSALLPRLREICGLDQIDDDWTVEKRMNDAASLSYGPCPEPSDPKDGWL